MSAARIIGLWTPIALYVAGIHFVSGRSLPHGPAAGWDKFLHALAYLGLGILCLRACHGGIKPLRLGPAIVAIVLTAGYGALDEFHQSHVPGRDASVADWLADTVGAALALPATVLARHAVDVEQEGSRR